MSSARMGPGPLNMALAATGVLYFMAALPGWITETSALDLSRASTSSSGISDRKLPWALGNALVSGLGLQLVVLGAYCHETGVLQLCAIGSLLCSCCAISMWYPSEHPAPMLACAVLVAQLLVGLLSHGSVAQHNPEGGGILAKGLLISSLGWLVAAYGILHPDLGWSLGELLLGSGHDDRSYKSLGWLALQEAVLMIILGGLSSTKRVLHMCAAVLVLFSCFGYYILQELAGNLAMAVFLVCIPILIGLEDFYLLDSENHGAKTSATQKAAAQCAK